MAVPGNQPIRDGFTSAVNQPMVVEAVGGEKRRKVGVGPSDI